MIDKGFENFQANRHAPLEHIFGNHEFCPDECPVKRAKDSGNAYVPKRPYLCKKLHLDIYLQLLAILDYFTTDEKIRQQLHRSSTQPNKALNAGDVTMSPKHRHFSSTCSLQDRSNTMIAAHNLGEVAFYLAIAELIGISVSDHWKNYLEVKWQRKIKRRLYVSKPKVKAARKECQQASLK
uniref:Uncharacterized protein n=1 Tax=Pseudictyota dubia TaxID=2749911 RepID=A0A7R9W7Y9_9STRA|mmetsp:Transcript_37840/g.69877  ORF Transcript_37840/g.69877 Transcript_37840/m.69877 type:complete len:181 (+) Transcript_37840:38-580(+)